MRTQIMTLLGSVNRSGMDALIDFIESSLREYGRESMLMQLHSEGLGVRHAITIEEGGHSNV